MGIGIALDLGSSGIRAQAIDLSEGAISAQACTLWHPLPGGNVIDHILFALTYGQDLANGIVVKTVNRLIDLVAKPDDIELIAVCGNPIQLGLFTNGEMRDLAFSADALKRKGIAIPSRESRIFEAGALGLDARCDVLVPPSIKAEVGADAIAMIKKSGMLQKDLALAIDFGTNAEMALKSGGSLYVASAAAGPAIEGQHINNGMLAAPRAICDLEYDWGWKCRVLNEQMSPQDGDTVDLTNGKEIKRRNIRATGITGTGVTALVSIGLETGCIDPPRIITGSRKLSLQDGIDFDEDDLLEASKAFGAIRAGCRTLASKADLSLEEIGICFMTGAAGSFADPYKVRNIGLVPGQTKIVHQLGNTSLKMAADLVCGKEKLEGMQAIADRAIHISFSASETFKRNYLREYAYWCEGARYWDVEAFGPEQAANRPAMRIIRGGGKMSGSSMKYLRPHYYIPAPAPATVAAADSYSYQRCVQACPKRALLWRDGRFKVDLRRCLGASCLRCERACSGFRLGDIRIESKKL